MLAYFYPILVSVVFRFGLCVESDLLLREARGYQEGREEKARSGIAHLPTIDPFNPLVPFTLFPKAIRPSFRTITYNQRSHKPEIAKQMEATGMDIAM